MSRSGSFSSIEESAETKVRFEDLTEEWKTSIKSGLKALKRQNPKAKQVIIKGTAHQSSTVPEHSDVISCQIRDKDGNYLGSAHIDENGTAFSNAKWQKNAS